MSIQFNRYTEKAIVPLRATPGSAASDLFSAYKHTLFPLKPELVQVDLHMEIPKGFYGLVTGRSSLTLKGITAHVGTIDSDFRGVVCIILTNLTRADYVIEYGDRVGQITILRYEDPKWVESSCLLETTRKGGFGSTGK